MTIDFVAGQFQPLYPNRNIHLGKLTQEIKPGDTVEFDGVTLRFNGRSVEYPEFRASVKAGWLDLSPQEALVQGKARGPLETKMALSREENMVSKVSDPKKDTVSPKAFTASVVKVDEGDHVTVREFSKKSSTKDIGGAEEGEVVGTFPSATQSFVLGEDGKVSAQKTSSRVASGTESDDSRTVGKIASILPSKTTVTDTSQVEQEIRRLETPAAKKQSKVAVVATPDGEVHAAEGDTVESILPALDPETRAALLAKQRKEAIARSEAKSSKKDEPEPPQAPVVVKPKVPTSLEEVVVSGDDVEIAPGVTWNKKLHWRTRAKIAVEKYANDPSTLSIIRSYEEPSVVKLIGEQLARLESSVQ